MSSWPTELKYKRDERALHVAFDDGAKFVLPAEYLRVESPSAEVQGHGAATKVLVPGKRNITIGKIDEVGLYAVRITFSDGHDTGLFSWDYLHQLGREQAKRWFEYETKLKAAGLKRDA